MGDSFSKEPNGEINESDAYKRERDRREEEQTKAINDFLIPFARTLGMALAGCSITGDAAARDVCNTTDKHSRLLVDLLFEMAGMGWLDSSLTWRRIKRELEKQS